VEPERPVERPVSPPALQPRPERRNAIRQPPKIEPPPVRGVASGPAIEPATPRFRERVIALESVAERRVEVRIGTIEIHGSDLEPSLLPTPPPEAPAASPMPAASGFDDFAAIRTYAPWTNGR
jgi:hypothetical protein